MNGNAAGGEASIQWPETERGALFTKRPQAPFAEGALLSVGEEQVALWLRDGMLVATFGPGSYPLSPSTVPALQMAVDSSAPGVIQGELYWVSTRPAYGYRFGGRCGVVRCPRTGETATPMVLGTVAFRVTDPPRLVISLAAGSSADEILQIIKGKLMHHLGACIAEWVAGGYFGLTQLPAIGPQLAQAVPPHCQDIRDLGVEVLSLDITNVSISAGG